MARDLSTLGFLLLLACAGAVSAQTLEELCNDGKNTDNVLTDGMGYHLNRSSALNQINKTYSSERRIAPRLPRILAGCDEAGLGGGLTEYLPRLRLKREFDLRH